MFVVVVPKGVSFSGRLVFEFRYGTAVIGLTFFGVMQLILQSLMHCSQLLGISVVYCSSLALVRARTVGR